MFVSRRRRWVFVGALVAGSSLFAAGCTSDGDQVGVGNNELPASVDGSAACTEGAIAGAVGGMTTTVERYGCVDGYAWAWIGDDEGSSDRRSLILASVDGQWSELDAACAGALTGYPAEVLELGCEYAPRAQTVTTPTTLPDPADTAEPPVVAQPVTETAPSEAAVAPVVPAVPPAQATPVVPRAPLAPPVPAAPRGPANANDGPRDQGDGDEDDDDDEDEEDDEDDDDNNDDD